MANAHELKFSNDGTCSVAAIRSRRYRQERWRAVHADLDAPPDCTLTAASFLPFDRYLRKGNNVAIAL
jgi:hypothetical protein